MFELRTIAGRGGCSVKRHGYTPEPEASGQHGNSQKRAMERAYNLAFSSIVRRQGKPGTRSLSWCKESCLHKSTVAKVMCCEYCSSQDDCTSGILTRAQTYLRKVPQLYAVACRTRGHLAEVLSGKVWSLPLALWIMLEGLPFGPQNSRHELAERCSRYAQTVISSGIYWLYLESHVATGQLNC